MIVAECIAAARVAVAAVAEIHLAHTVAAVAMGNQSFEVANLEDLVHLMSHEG